MHRLLAASNLQDLERDIQKYNFGKPLNVASPKQVSLAIFGTVQSTSRDVLVNASQGVGVSHERQQTLAKLVLQHRALKSKRQAFSSLATNDDIVEEEVVHGIAKRPIDRVQEVPSTTTKSETSGASYASTVEELFQRRSKVNDYWKEPLLLVTKPSARQMVLQLNALQCPMGYDPLAVPLQTLGSSVRTSESTAGKKGSLLHYVRDQKDRYPDCIILTRVGEFYETYGVDAVMLVEVSHVCIGLYISVCNDQACLAHHNDTAQHCGLNAMAGKARAGCPVRNVQATLDCLTSNGFRVAVYEEAVDTDANSGATRKSRLKNRMLAQLVSTASPTYLYDLVLSSDTRCACSIASVSPLCRCTRVCGRLCAGGSECGGTDGAHFGTAHGRGSGLSACGVSASGSVVICASR